MNIIRSMGIIALSTLWIGCSTQASIYFPAHLVGQKVIITPQNTQWGFDIHEVLVEKQYGKMIKKSLANAGSVFSLRPSHYNHYRSLGGKKMHTIERMVATANQFPELEYCIPGIINIANSRKAISGMPAVLAQLKTQGHTLRILSNISPEEFNGWNSSTKNTQGTSRYNARGLKDKLSDVFQHFDGGVIDAKKPANSGFVTFKTQYATNDTKHFIFIDDKKENVEAAVANGYIGIHFKDAKGFKADLYQLGLRIA